MSAYARWVEAGRAGLSDVLGSTGDAPRRLLADVAWLLKWLPGVAIVCGASGLWLGLAWAPVNGPRGELARIVYLHAPATWVALLVFGLIALCGFVAFMAKSPVASIVAQALAPTGLLFAFLALWSGSLWARPIYGTWWDWSDFRLVTHLVLLCVYLAMVGVRSCVGEAAGADRAVAVLAIVGLAVIATVTVLAKAWLQWPTRAAMHASGDWASPGAAGALLLVTLGFVAYAATAVALRLRCVILERERHSEWVEPREAWR